jgi:DNA primase
MGGITVAQFNCELDLTPTEYYSYQFPGISTNREMAKVICPFHDDTHPSLSINLEAGWYKCHACGAKGGGITKFHMTRYSLTYKQTITELENFHA